MLFSSKLNMEKRFGPKNYSATIITCNLKQLQNRE